MVLLYFSITHSIMAKSAESTNIRILKFSRQTNSLALGRRNSPFLIHEHRNEVEKEFTHSHVSRSKNLSRGFSTTEIHKTCARKLTCGELSTIRKGNSLVRVTKTLKLLGVAGSNVT